MTVTDTGATTRARAQRAPTTPSVSAVASQPTRPPVESDGLGRPADVPRGSWRERARSKPGLGHAYRIGVFAAGLLFIALGFALAVLPGPLTIPPVLIGLWIWSTEFRFAERFFDSFKRKATEAWAHAKAHPSSSAAITIGVSPPPASQCGPYRTSS